MEGGVNAFLRSRPPLEVTPSRPWPPSRRICQLLFRVSASVWGLLAIVYFLSFVGLTMQGYGWIAIPLFVGAVVMLLPLGRPEFMPRRWWNSRWPFQPDVPAWVGYVALAAILLFICTILFQAATSVQGEPRIIDGVEVMWSKGEGAFAITHEQYASLRQAQLRIVVSWLMIGWVQAAAFWALQVQKHAETNCQTPRFGIRRGV